MWVLAISRKPPLFVGMASIPAGVIMRATVVLIGSYTLLRDGIGRLLPARFQVVASADTVQEAIALTRSTQRPAIMILVADDYGRDMFRQIADFRAWASSGRVVVVGRHWQASDIFAALAAGVSACMGEISDTRAFVKAIELVMHGVCILSPEVLMNMTSPGTTLQIAGPRGPQELPRDANGCRGSAGLSRQEKRILHCLSEGDPNKVIAQKLHVTESTVKVHVKAILRKIRVANRTQAAIWAMNRPPDQAIEANSV
jgi:two-component system, NarL family, nitrate/nitrite response regulator NarL